MAEQAQHQQKAVASAATPPAVATAQAGICFVDGEERPDITTKEACEAAHGRWQPASSPKP